MRVDGHLADAPSIDFFDQCPNDFVLAPRRTGSPRLEPIARDEHHVRILGINHLCLADFECGVGGSDRGDFESLGFDFLARPSRQKRLDDQGVAGSHSFKERSDDLFRTRGILQVQRAQRDHFLRRQAGLLRTVGIGIRSDRGTGSVASIARWIRWVGLGDLVFLARVTSDLAKYSGEGCRPNETLHELVFPLRDLRRMGSWNGPSRTIAPGHTRFRGAGSN